MTLNKDTRILIVGLGLMGGSYAKALTRRGYRVSAITKEQSSVDYALREGIIAYGTTAVDPELIARSELIVFALYPHIFIEWIKENQQYFSAGTVITDLTGVKGCVVGTVQDMLRPDVEFIAAHPMAGRELYGVEHSDDSVFRGANYIVTPTEKNTPAAIALCEQLGRELGFYRISRLTVAEHDDMIAYLSQLTHCIAVTLMNCNDSPHMQAYTGDSFRDLTRIAKINDVMWTELFMSNREALLHHMDAFEKSFEAFRQLLINRDVEGMRAAMRAASARRALFDKKTD
mgnify:FL=1